MINSLKEFVLSVLLLKDLKLHLFAPLLGFAGVLYAKRLDRVVWPLFGLIGIGLVHVLVLKDLTILYRVAQLTGILCLFSYLSHEKMNYLKFAYAVLVIGIIYCIYDLSVGSTVFQKSVLGISLIRFKGMVGEYNFSAAVYVGSALIFIRYKKYQYLLISLVLLFLTGSRAGILTMIFMPFFILIERTKYLKKIVFLLFLTYPLLVFLTSFLSLDNQIKINNVSSKRLAIQRNILHIVAEEPLGVGYFRGRNVLKNHENATVLPYKSNEAHNLTLQVLFEFGFLGLLCLVAFAAFLVMRLNIFYPVTSMFFMFSFLNGLHEIMLYVIMSMCLTYEGRDPL